MAKRLYNTKGEVIYDKHGRSSNLIFLEYVKNPKDIYNTYVNVECILCGKTARKGLADVRFGKTRSCGCLTEANKTELAGYTRKYKTYRKSARDRTLEFSLPFEEFHKLAKQNCHYCNAEPKETRERYGGRISKKTGLRRESFSLPYKFSTIDRIDNTKGYISGNCRSSCIQCNMMKMHYTESDFLNKIKSIYNHLLTIK